MADNESIGLFRDGVAENVRAPWVHISPRLLRVEEPRRRPPKLCPDTVSDEERLAAACCEVTRRDGSYRRRTRRILARQSALRHLVTKPAWAAYLLLEEAVNDRAGHEVTLIARWAFSEGARSKRRRR